MSSWTEGPKSLGGLSNFLWHKDNLTKSSQCLDKLGRSFDPEKERRFLRALSENNGIQNQLKCMPKAESLGYYVAEARWGGVRPDTVHGCARGSKGRARVGDRTQKNKRLDIIITRNRAQPKIRTLATLEAERTQPPPWQAGYRTREARRLKLMKDGLGKDGLQMARKYGPEGKLPTVTRIRPKRLQRNPPFTFAMLRNDCSNGNI